MSWMLATDRRAGGMSKVLARSCRLQGHRVGGAVSQPHRVIGEHTLWQAHVLSAEGLEGWVVRESPDGYCWRNRKILDVIPGDSALFLHEVAHALTEPISQGDQHHGMWADRYTRLVAKYMEPRGRGG